MKWYQIKDKKPPEWEDVLVCFDAKNENSCLVAAMDPRRTRWETGVVLS